ncbi:MAG: hypothetical protein LBN05_01285 [Oscillospiraceae bacterium]|jgi:hypothetical protein|nr:hypothetical protein [Oscillospiraceae bacterium]
MSAISSMPADIAQWLGEQEPLAGIAFIPEYPAVNKAVPLQQATVAVGLEGVNISDAFVENGQGVLEEQEYCRTAKLRLRLGIYAPYAQGGAYCHDVFTKVTDCLTFGSDLEITQSNAGRISSDRDTDAFVLECVLDVKADFCPAVSSDLSFPSFLNKDLLCGSHITDAQMHFSTAEKERFNQPFVSGLYVGNDVNVRSFNLGFQPRLVQIYCNDFPPTAPLTSGSGIGAYSATAVYPTAMMGMNVTSTGFRLATSNGYEIRGVFPRLNEAPLAYTYIAWR